MKKKAKKKEIKKVKKAELKKIKGGALAKVATAPAMMEGSCHFSK